jgi:hypothetical protein
MRYKTVRGTDRPAIMASMQAGQLVCGKVTWCRDYVEDASEAVQRLMNGETIKINQSAALFLAVQRRVEGR